MSGAQEDNGDVIVSCEVCLKQIPHEHAGKDETEDYVRYFCGLECYQRWKGEEGKQQEE